MVARKPKPQVRLIVALDPAEHAGVAVYWDGALVGSAPAPGKTCPGILGVLEPLARPYLAQTAPGERLAVIEKHWVGGFINGAMTLAARRGKAEAAAEMLDIMTHKLVGPSTWQNAVFGPYRGQDTKELSKRKASQIAGRPIEDDNEADAICMGTWALTA